MNRDRPALQLAVVMEREAQPNRWENWRFKVIDVVVDEGGFGAGTRVLRDDGQRLRTLHPGFMLALYRDEGEGYFLNLSSGSPVWFVMWRVDDASPGQASPQALSVSYNEAGRWLDAQERVDNVPMPAAARAWLQAFVDEHYKPELKQRRRPASFVSPDKRS